MYGAINGTSPLKFVLISGHDTTFLAFLSAVAPGAWDEVFPPYASLSTIELLRVGGEEGVAGDYFRFVYNGQVLRLKGCDQGESSCKEQESCVDGRKRHVFLDLEIVVLPSIITGVYGHLAL